MNIEDVEKYGFVKDKNGDYYNGPQIFYYYSGLNKFVFCESSKSDNIYFDSVDAFITFYTK